MPAGMHLTLLVASEAVGGTLASVLVALNLARAGVRGIPLLLAFFVAAHLGVTIPRLVFTYWVHARCRKCNGRSRFHGGYPFTYHCAACGHVHRSRFGEGD